MIPRQITARFPSKCRRCSTPVLAGAPILFCKDWSRGQRTVHVACATDEDRLGLPIPPVPTPEYIPIPPLTDVKDITPEETPAMLDEPETEPKPKAPKLTLSLGGLEDVVRQIAREEAASAAPRVDEPAVQAIVGRALASRREVTVVGLGEAKRQDIAGATHAALPRLLREVGIRHHVVMYGPAGTGKSHAALQVSEALSLKFYCESVGPQTTQSAMIGYSDAHSRVVRTHFREVFEHGGLYCMDEVDSGSASVLTVLNSALSNGVCAFPDGMVKRHPDFRMVATANTAGMGKTSEFMGRAALDGAFRDRFSWLPWPIDPYLEDTLYAATGGPVSWPRYVNKVRKALDAAGLPTLSTRRIVRGGESLAAGATWDEVVEEQIMHGLSQDARTVVDAVRK